MSNKDKIIEFENKVYDHLVNEKKYPADAIVPQYKIGNFTTDFTIIDNKTKEIIAVFELKNLRENAFTQQRLSGFNSRIKQLIRANGIDIPVFYVLKNDDTQHPFTIKILNQIKGEEGSTKFVFDKISLPSYSELSMQNSANIVKNNKNNLKESTYELKRVCRFLAVIIFIIWLFCKYQKVDITWVDLAFISASAALFIFPYIKKIEVSQLSIEFFNIEHKNKDK